ncbi:MAG: hypothetical protein FJ301_12705 [Planctomycetes bacterium]|nr:hypothetical protein [Planctomycetota bacterium]
MTSRPASAALAAAALGLLSASPLGGCNVATNLYAGELLYEIDQIVRVEGSAPDYRVGYLDRADTSSWLHRALFVWVESLFENLLFRAIRDAFDSDDERDNERDDASDVGISASEVATLQSKLDKPVDHVRALLRELPHEVGGDLRLAGLAASRCAWIAHYDVHPLSRLVALDGLVAIAESCDAPLFRGDLRRHGFAPETAEFAAAAARVQTQRPQRQVPRPIGDRSEYLADLAAVVVAPRQAPHERILLVEMLTEAVLAETDAAVRDATFVALRAACVHLVERLLIDLVMGRELDDVDVRLCAMEHVRRLAGTGGVPFLLALMVADAAQSARGEPQYDPDPLVRLRLIHYCGQLRGPMLDATLALPGRSGAMPVAPAEFLAVTALTETAYTSRLRTPAITALSWALQRPRVDHDLAWIREWRQGRR